MLDLSLHEPHDERPIDEAIARIWQVLPRWQTGRVERGELRALAREVGTEAQRAAMLPEQLVLSVKRSWASHPMLRDPQVRRDAQGLLADVVGLCIAEYFRSCEREQRIRREQE